VSAVDWPALLRAGLCGLGLTPEAFWRLTPAELRLMLGLDAAAAPMTRGRLDELARAFAEMEGDKRDGRNGQPRRADRRA
jgi:uncharacterized phage protein (TIGR02216 family)